jgi:hypothetical protein
METVTLTLLKDLLKKSRPPCVSIYMSTVTAGPDRQQNPIRYRNLLEDAHRQLVQQRVRPQDARTLLQPAAEIGENQEFWRNCREGLAVFCDSSGVQTLRLPIAFSEMVQAGKRPVLMPLLPLLYETGRYYVLAVSENHVRLLAGIDGQASEVSVPGLPVSRQDALGERIHEGQFLVHSGQSGAPGKQGKVFYGQGRMEQEAVELEAFLRCVDRAIAPYLQQHAGGAPLLFCGSKRLFATYREINSYPHLYEISLPGNFDRMPVKDIAIQAEQVLAPHWRKEVDRAFMVDHLGSELVSADLEAILPAAHQGRIAALFVATDVKLRGHYHVQSETLAMADVPAQGEDLLELAATATIEHGGKVYAMHATELPAGLVAAAIYRYVT